MKVVLDCNIIISFLISPGKNIQTIIDCWKEEKFELLISVEILEEIKYVLDRLVTKSYFNNYHSTNLYKTILRKATLIDVITKVNVSSDKKDNRYLSCSKDGKANYLITGDKRDLIPIKKYKYTKIITPSDFALILSDIPSKLN